MSDISSILETIEAPNLTESNYGENIQQQFADLTMFRLTLSSHYTTHQ